MSPGQTEGITSVTPLFSEPRADWLIPQFPGRGEFCSDSCWRL